MKDCDFIPASHHEAVLISRALKRRATMIGTLIGAMVLWVIVQRHQISSAQAVMTEIENGRQQISDHLIKRDAMEIERTRLDEQHQLVSRLFNGSHLAVVLSDLSRRQPDTIVLISMTLQAPGLSAFVAPKTETLVDAAGTPTGPQAHPPIKPLSVSQKPSQLTLVGIASSAPDVIRFAAELERSPFLDQVQMQSKGAVRWAGRRAEKFELKCELVRRQGER